MCHNGDFFPAEEPVLLASNRGFKWGDGIFETIKVSDRMIRLSSYHFDRLFSGCTSLQIGTEALDRTFLEQNILELCRLNDCEKLARVRVAIYRDQQMKAGYVIEAIPLEQKINEWNEYGLQIGVYPFARKSIDGFSNLKSANHLPYLMAGMYAAEKGWDDALVLNSSHKIADSSKANIFLVKKDEVFTPALNQGCVAGVMRRFLIDEMEKQAITVHQASIDEEELLQADEVFLTNALVGLRWVKAFNSKSYKHARAKVIYETVFNAARLL
jgi:branched-chain amino acid aminotransferase